MSYSQSLLRLNNAYIVKKNDLRPFLRSHYKSFTDSTSAFRHRFGDLLFFARLFITNSIPFLVPITLSLHISLGLCFEPVCLNAPITHYGLSQRIFLLNRANNDFSLPYISIQSGFRPVHSQICQSLFGHSNHRHFVDSRPVSNTVRLRTDFVAFALRLLSADFTELLTV